MFKDSRQEYMIKTCPTSDVEKLEALLNDMAKNGWDLYSMSEAEAENGDYQYNCIFIREFEEDDEIEEDDSINVGDFCSKMEKIFQKDAYIECKDIQINIKKKREEIAKIKASLDADMNEDERNRLNLKMENSIKELNNFKTKLLEVISPDKMFETLDVKKITILLSEELIELVNPDNQAELIAESVKVRKNLAERLGYVIPAVQFRVDDSLEAAQYKIKVRDMEVFEGRVFIGHKMFYKKNLSLTKKPQGAIEDIDWLLDEKVWWIEDDKTQKYWEKGLSPQEVIAEKLEYVACRFVDEIFDYNDVNKLIEIVAEKNLYLIENIVPDFLSVGELRYILANLIREDISIKDISFIFEKINDFSEDDDKALLLEKIRTALSLQISHSVADEAKVIYGINLSENTISQLEEIILNEEPIITLKSSFVKKIFKKTQEIIKNANISKENIAIIAKKDIRQLLFQIMEQFIPNMRVISPEEVSLGFSLEVIGEI